MSEIKRRDYRVIFFYNFKRGLTAEECLEEMSEVFHENCPSRSSVFRWFQQFQKGLINLDDDPRSGRPSEAITPENKIAVEKLVKENPRITYRQIESLLKIGAPAINSILHDSLDLTKICSLWVPQNLTETQRASRVKWCRDMVKKFESGRSNLVNFLVTGNEAWLYYYDVPTKSRNKVWLFEDEVIPQAPRKCLKKKMIIVFFGKRGIVERMVVDEQKVEDCMPQLMEALKMLRPRIQLDSWYLHYPNMPESSWKLLKESGLTILEHPQHSADLAPCDFGLFPFIKQQLKGLEFGSEDELIGAWDQACADVSQEKWTEIFLKWFYHMEKCIELDGEYYENY